MERLLKEFERRITGADGATYRASAYGRSRPSDAWQGWLVFEGTTDARRFATEVETTQPSAEAIDDWANALTDANVDDAFRRAAAAVSADARAQRLRMIEDAVLAAFTDRRSARLVTQTVLDALEYSHADVVRALQNLEQQRRLLVRSTEEGEDWLALTELGVDETGVRAVR